MQGHSIIILRALSGPFLDFGVLMKTLVKGNEKGKGSEGEGTLRLLQENTAPLSGALLTMTLVLVTNAARALLL